MGAKKEDPLGAAYWSTPLTREQSYFCAALREDYHTLRSVFDRVEEDAFQIKASTKWERLHVLGLLDADHSRKDDIYVKRGPQWHSWWEKGGLALTDRQLTTYELLEEMRSIFNMRSH